ncbi:hypothetical protein D4764_05G0007570 [Takifugu flavidus]|uniref:Uncharacterized protein n=1 Tax=Takifugu flavidus TaxID=433684 RepID=A0A5C6N4J8_9TELE|nr:hypothetical protein D4764_05G0007570 [Takifugu flavidus]
MELIDDTFRFLKEACPQWRPHLLLVLGQRLLSSSSSSSSPPLPPPRQTSSGAHLMHSRSARASGSTVQTLGMPLLPVMGRQLPTGADQNLISPARPRSFSFRVELKTPPA